VGVCKHEHIRCFLLFARLLSTQPTTYPHAYYNNMQQRKTGGGLFFFWGTPEEREVMGQGGTTIREGKEGSLVLSSYYYYLSSPFVSVLKPSCYLFSHILNRINFGQNSFSCSYPLAQPSSHSVSQAFLFLDSFCFNNFLDLRLLFR